MSNKKTSKLASILALALGGLLIVVSVWVLTNRQYVMDQVSAWSYTPSTGIEQISKNVKFTDKGQLVFYATKPVLADQDRFNAECPRQEKSSPIIGCYTTRDDIFIYHLTNSDLEGMEEVTAVHEMLHAAWYRMDKNDREDISKQLVSTYESVKNGELKARMDYYNRAQPGEFANELHSIIGTEVPSLSSELESYYSQYFDRTAVLRFHDSYSSTYKSLHAQADSLFDKMNALSVSIDKRGAAYNSQSSALTVDIANFNTRADSGSFTSVSQFNWERSRLVARSNNLEAERTAINADVDEYNAYYKQYQSIADEIRMLNDSIDSYHRIDKAPAV